MKSKRLLALIFTAAVTVSLAPVLRTQVVKADEVQAIRISGTDRYETAANAAKGNWSTADNVILVSGEGYADAVSASVLAKKLDAPILLTNSKSLNSYAESAIDTLKPKNVYVIGGKTSVSDEIRNFLRNKSYNLIELGGSNRYETNAAVADKLVELGLDPSNIVLVSGEGFADALSTASIASAKNEILLLGNNNLDYINTAAEFIKNHKSKTTIVGSSTVIDDNTYKAVNGVNRISGGNDRFDTNLRVLSSFKKDIKFDVFYSANASGDGYADALTASVLAAKNNAPLLLLDTEASAATENAINYLKSNLTSASKVEIFGGNVVISQNVENRINNVILGKNLNNEASRTFTGYITTEDDFVSNLHEDTADMIHMKKMALSGLGITFQQNGEWVFYYLDGDIATNNSSGEGGKWSFNGTGFQLSAWNIVEEQVLGNGGMDKMNPIPVTVTGILDGSTNTNPGLDADGINYPVIKAESIISK